MQAPKILKYRKRHRSRNRGLAANGTKVSFGEFGMRTTSRGRITSRQIEAARRAITRHIKRAGRVWIRVFADKPVSQKPVGVRMGKGKGNPDFFVSELKPGKVLYELEGVKEELAREAFRLAGAKLPVATAFIRRGH